MKNLIKITSLLLLVFITGSLVSCSDDGPKTPESTTSQSTVLIYAVATNNLSSNLVSDMNEMLYAAQNIDLNKNNVLVFETLYEYNHDKGKTESAQILVKLTKTGEKYEWTILKEYPRDLAALSQERIREVLGEVARDYPADYNGLIFWSHSTASQPYYGTKGVSLPSQESFGSDSTAEDDAFQEINIDDLANALPDNFYDFIWFDSCYMSNIETIYQMRDKSRYFVGAPTEVMANGMPYDLTLPFMVGENPDIVKAAEAFFNYYSRSIATIAVVDQSKIDKLASLCKNIYNKNQEVDTDDLKKYTRYSTGPFYDFGDYTKAMARAEGVLLTDDEWNSVLDEVVIYKAATPGDFNYPTAQPIYPERYSGISTHLYKAGDNIESEKYYRSLDWYQAVFEN